MSILPIYLYPHPVLRQKALPVTVFDAQLKKLGDDMMKTMSEARGLGLAGNQVGKLQRIVALDFDYLHKILEHYKEPPCPEMPQGKGVMINPELVEVSASIQQHEGEGCLSIPEIYTSVERPEWIVVRFSTPTQKTVQMKLYGIAAAAVHHEIDHLDGLVFFDRVSRLKKNMLEKKYKKEATYFKKFPRYLIVDEQGIQHEQNLEGWMA